VARSAPFEWRRQINDVSFYTQNLEGEPLPNDDLDIQLLWLVALEECGIEINAHTLAEYWCLYVTPHWAEYGTAKINMRSGLMPPLSGTTHNAYKDSCGAFIRSEIWACIAPGRPDIATRYAFEDAILDHGNGEGTYAEVFVAALESAAFAIADMRALIDIGLSYIPTECEVAKAVGTATRAIDAGLSWREARDEILRLHRGSSHMNMPELTSPEDREKGFHQGKQGYDVPSNIGLMVFGLLYGGDDFDKMICTIVNCGEDTDCTGATAGSIYGIIHGATAIPQRWIDPIGRSIKTACLNLGELGYFGNQLPQTVDELTDRTERVAQQVLLRHSAGEIVDAVGETASITIDDLVSQDDGAGLYRALNGPKFTFDMFTVALDYGESPLVRDNEPKTIRLTIYNDYKVQTNVSLHWYLSEGWHISPSADAYALVMPQSLGEPPTFEFTLQCEHVTRALTRGVVELTAEGRPMTMLVPIALQNGNQASIDH